MDRTMTNTQRTHYLDWLRVLLILTVFVFHSQRFFDKGDWQIKNAQTYLGSQLVTDFLSTWMMPTIFVVSGVAVFLALAKRRPGQFVLERSLRLGVPLAIGILTHVALQNYLERVTHQGYTGTFWQFYPDYLARSWAHGPIWLGNHLWYLGMLFVFSVVCLPLFWWLRRGSGTRALAWLGDRLSGPAVILLPMIFEIAPSSLLSPRLGDWADYNGTGGWNTPAYLVFFLFGFLLASSPRMQATILRLRRTYLGLGLAGLVATFGTFAVVGGLNPGTPGFALIFALRGAACWGCMLAILGYAMQYLMRSTPFLEYANEAVLPFYVMHQSALLVIGFFVVRWPIPDLFKWAFIFVASFASIMGLYELLIRRNNVLRFLFGMKPMNRAPRPVAVSRQTLVTGK
jgi:glucans biosynthesis protein C